MNTYPPYPPGQQPQNGQNPVQPPLQAVPPAQPNGQWQTPPYGYTQNTPPYAPPARQPQGSAGVYSAALSAARAGRASSHGDPAAAPPMGHEMGEEEIQGALFPGGAVVAAVRAVPAPVPLAGFCPVRRGFADPVHRFPFAHCG